MDEYFIKLLADFCSTNGGGGGGSGGGGGGSSSNSAAYFAAAAARSSPRNQQLAALGAPGASHFDPNSTERFSRKVFVGGLPPDIDEGSFE